MGVGTTEESARISGDTLSCVVQSTVTVFLLVRDVLRESDMTGRQHYMFSLSHIESAFQVYILVHVFCTCDSIEACT